MNVSPINCHTKVDSNNSIQQKPCVNFKGLKLPVKLADSPFLYGQKNILNRFKDIKNSIFSTSIVTAAGGIIQTHEDKKRQKRRNGNAYQNLGIYCRNYRDKAYHACANADSNINTDACNILINRIEFFNKERKDKLTNSDISMENFGNLTELQEELLCPLLNTFENAKDKNGNHTSDNLKFLELLIEKDDFNFDGMTAILRKSKDEEGNIDTDAAKIFYDIFIDARRHQDVGDFGDLMQQYNSLSEEGKKDFINLYKKHGVQGAGAFHKIVQESKGKDFEKIIIAINSYMDEYNYEWNHWKPNPILGSLKKATYYQKTKGDNANEGISYENFKHCFIKTISEKHTVDEMDEYFFEEFKRKNQLKNYAQFINNLTFLLQKNNIYLRSIYEKLNNLDNIMEIAEYCRLSGNTNEIIKAIDSDLDTLSIETILQCLEKSCEIRKYTNGSSSKVANFEKYKELTAILQNDKNLRSIYKKLNNLDNIMEIAELCRYSDNINEILQAIDSDLNTHPIETILQCLEKSCEIRKNKNGSYKVPNFEKYKKIQEVLQNDKNFTIPEDLLKDKNGVLSLKNLTAFEKINDLLLEQNIKKDLSEQFNGDYNLINDYIEELKEKNPEEFKNIKSLAQCNDRVCYYAKLLKDKDGIIKDENVELLKDILSYFKDENKACIYAEISKDKDGIIKRENFELLKNIPDNPPDNENIHFYAELLKDEDGIISIGDFDSLTDIFKYFSNNKSVFQDDETVKHCITYSKDSEKIINSKNVEFYKEFYVMIKDKEIVGKLLTILKGAFSGVVEPESKEKLKEVINKNTNPKLLYKNIDYLTEKLKNKKGKIQFDYINVFSELKSELDKINTKISDKKFTEILTLSCDSNGNIYKEINEILPELIRKNLISDIPNILKISVHNNKFNKDNYTKAVYLIKNSTGNDKDEMSEYLLKCVNNEGILDDKQINLFYTLINAGFKNIIDMTNKLSYKEIDLLITLEKNKFENISGIAANLMGISNDDDYQKALDLVLYLREDSDSSIEPDLPKILDFCKMKNGKMDDKSINDVKKLKDLKPSIKLSEILTFITLNNNKLDYDNKLNAVTHFLKEIDIKNIGTLKTLVDAAKTDNNQENYLFDEETGEKLVELYKKYGESTLKIIPFYRINEAGNNKIDKWHFYKDKHGKNNNKLLDALIKYPSHLEFNLRPLMKFKEDFLFKEYSKKNLYFPENLYEFLSDLKANYSFRKDNENVLYREIEDHEPLFFMLPAVAVEKEKQEIIEKIIELLCSLDCYKYDFNRKDSNEIPFIDKVISSENPALIYFINHVPKENLTYHTGLYKIAESVQDPKFKAELQKLDFDCKEWKEAAEMCFCAAIRKLLPIIKSPLFNQDKMVLQAWEIAKKARNGVNSKTDFAQLLCNEFIDDISHTTMFKIMKEAQEIDNSSRNNNSPSRNSGYGNYPDDYTEWPEPLGLRF